jgi:hypothetical protein
MAAIGIGIGSAMTEQVLSIGGSHAVFTVLLALLGAAALGIAASGSSSAARRLSTLLPATARLRPLVLPH